MIDHGEADDKIIAVLDNDYVWGHARNIDDVPAVFIERLQHYFLTYKLVPGERAKVRIAKPTVAVTRFEWCARRWLITKPTSFDKTFSRFLALTSEDLRSKA